MGYRLGPEEISAASGEVKRRLIENVLIMQGGGSLGAFGCGVYKALVKKKIRIDVVAGTSIGAVNAAIIVGSKSGHPENDLEDFWEEIAESNHSIIPDSFTVDYDNNSNSYVTKKVPSASTNAAIFGVPKMFIPRWLRWNTSYYNLYEKEKEKDPFMEDEKRSITSSSYPYFDTRSWTYLYDHTPLAKTLEKYIDYKKLNFAVKKEESPEVLRLIITAVDVLTAKPLIFDNTKMEIKPKHILASSGYPIYGFPWVQVEGDGNHVGGVGDDSSGSGNNTYAWDGSLLSNTPIREVLNMSPKNDKNIFVVENYPRKVHRLPSNMAEVESRAKDILFCDKNMETLKMSRLITRQIQLIERLYNIFQRENVVDHSKLDPDEVKQIKSEYKKLIENHGAQILSVTRIVRSEIESPSILQNADFSPTTVKELMSQGERKTLQELNYCESVNYDFNR
jgi:NTE family protein